MTKDSLSKHLINVPQLHGGDADGKPGPDDLVRKEHAALHARSLEQDWAEQKRRHAEVVADIEEGLESVSTAVEVLQEQQQMLENALRNLETVAPAPDTIVTSAELRNLKNAVHNAHIELLRCRRVRDQAVGEGAALADLSSGELARLGFAVTWPIAVALLAAAAVIAAALALIFRY